MIAYSSALSQEKRRGFLDPRTKLALVLVLAVFVMGGLGGSQMKSIKIIDLFDNSVIEQVDEF